VINQSLARVWYKYMFCVDCVLPRHTHWDGILQVGHDDCRYGQHETAEHLFRVLRCTRAGVADERAVDRRPCTPLKLQHKATHAEYHAEQVHVVRGWVVSRTTRRRSLIPVYFTRTTRIIGVICRHVEPQCKFQIFLEKLVR